jgi:(aminoalkyl)phosphonate N-acetyltransferase
MTVRSATLKDAQKIWEFICELENTVFDFSTFQQYYKNNLSNNDIIYLVAVNEAGFPVGFISCHGQVLLHHLSKVFEIQELFVSKEHRNNNIGQLLIETLERRLKNSNYHFLEVTTNVKRIDTHRFYAKCGFERTHYKFTKILE